MYRAPIFEHRFPTSDFVVIRSGPNFFVREADAIFVVGQELPLVKVPAPFSKAANQTSKQLLKVSELLLHLGYLEISI